MYTKIISFVFVLFLSFNLLANDVDWRCESVDVGLDSDVLAGIDVIVQRSLDAKKFPGCVVCVGRNGRAAFVRSYGVRKPVDVNGAAVSMTDDTLFDMASLTKCIATTISVMILVDGKKINIDAPVRDYLTEFDTPEKNMITVRQLLTHTAGFVPDNALADYNDGIAAAWKRLLALKPVNKPGSRFSYSDVSFQVLGQLVERVSGQDINEFSRKNIFEPLGMNDTGFLPNAELSQRAAPTRLDQPAGKVHDPRSFLTGGVAGHAGLFSTAKDITIFADMLAGNGTSSGGKRIVSKKTFYEMITPNRLPNGNWRGLGWDMRTGSSNRPLNMSPRAFGHGGFTGTAFWFDPATKLFVLVLSNRVYPDGKGEVNVLAGEVGEIAAHAITDLADDTDSHVKIIRQGKMELEKSVGIEKVKNGLDVITSLPSWLNFEGKRIGFVTNHTAITRDGKTIVQVFKEMPNVKLTAIFSPEHGFTGQFDQPNVRNSTDAASGVPVYSLYDGNVRRPTAAMLDNVDVLVFDIQDIGTRFYTYISTMLYVMEAAAMSNAAGEPKEFVVLDRPNPIRGDIVEGAMLQAGKERFVGCSRLPIRHGLTTGELALLFNAQRRLGLNVYVVPCLGWKRDMDYDATKSQWIAPSPNMRSIDAAFLYSGIGLLEFTNISVGRGTPRPFEQVGATWIDAERLVETLRKKTDAAKLEGVSFATCKFKPVSSVYAGEECNGVSFKVENRETFRSVRLGIILATTLHELYPKQWETKNLNTLLLDENTQRMILNNASVTEIEATWQRGLESFMQIREQVLIY